MKRVLCLMLFSSLFFSLAAIDNLRLPDMRSLALGSNGVTQSVFHNPALLALSTGKSFHFDYFNRYGLKELGTMNGSYQQTNRFLPAGIQISTFGYGEYRETMARLLVGKRIARRWTLGIGIQYTWIQTLLDTYPAARLSTDLGATFLPFDNLLIGMLIRDFPSFTIRKQTSEIKEINSYKAEIGFQWKIINEMLIVGSLGACREVSLSGCLGIEYQVGDAFSFRAGLQTDPFQPTFGVGYRYKAIQIDIAAVYHSVLGISTGAGFTLSF